MRAEEVQKREEKNQLSLEELRRKMEKTQMEDTRLRRENQALSSQIPSQRDAFRFRSLKEVIYLVLVHLHDFQI